MCIVSVVQINPMLSLLKKYWMRTNLRAIILSIVNACLFSPPLLKWSVPQLIEFKRLTSLDFLESCCSRELEKLNSKQDTHWRQLQVMLRFSQFLSASSIASGRSVMLTSSQPVPTCCCSLLVHIVSLIQR